MCRLTWLFHHYRHFTYNPIANSTIPIAKEVSIAYFFAGSISLLSCLQLALPSSVLRKAARQGFRFGAPSAVEISTSKVITLRVPLD